MNISVTENTNTIEKLKQNVINENNQYMYYNANTGEVQTNIDNEGLKNLNYIYLERALPINSSYEIYTYINENRDLEPGVFIEQLVFELSKEFNWLPVALMPILIIAIFAMVIYLCFAIGHKKGHDGIYLNRFEKWPIELTTIFAFTVFICACAPITGFSFVDMSNNIQLVTILSFCMMFAIIAYISLAILTTIIIKKLWNTAFNNFDLDSNGKIDAKEMAAFLRLADNSVNPNEKGGDNARLDAYSLMARLMAMGNDDMKSNITDAYNHLFEQE